MADPIPKELMGVLACPKCRGSLSYNQKKTGLVCKKCDVTYPIRDGIPILMPPEE